MSFEQFLRYAGGTGVSVVVGVVLSQVIEYVAAYQRLGAKPKALVFVGLCFIIPVLAALLLGLLKYEPWSFDPLFWKALVAGFSAAGIGTLAHVPQKENSASA